MRSSTACWGTGASYDRALVAKSAVTWDLAADLELARRMGAVADDVALHYFQSDYQWGWKGDGSPVTEADLAVEEALLRMLAAERPDDHVLSEERGVIGGTGTRRWLLDPIDGTSYFLDGSSAWGSHIALEVDSVDAALEWWARFLVFELRGRRGGMAWIDLGDQFIALSEPRVWS